MRIVGGSLSGRKIEPPLSTVTRPMMDRVREALFNILAHRDWGKNVGDVFAEDVCVLDAFCGTGDFVGGGAGDAFRQGHRGVEDCAAERGDFGNYRQVPDIGGGCHAAPQKCRNAV